MRPHVIVWDLRRLPKWLALATGGLLTASVLGQVSRYVLGRDHIFGLVPLFNVNLEHNVPSLFSTLLLATASSLLLLLGRLEDHENSDRVYWQLLGCLFAFLALDESLSLHEQLNRPAAALLGTSRHPLLYYSWAVPGALFVGTTGLVFLRFVLRRPPRMRFYLIASAVLFVGGAIGMELIGGRHAKLYGKDSLTYNLLCNLEEALEMSGVLVFITALVSGLREHQTIQWRLDGGAVTDQPVDDRRDRAVRKGTLGGLTIR